MKISLLASLVFFSFTLFAQEGRSPAIDFLRDRAAELGLSADDIADLRVTDEYASPSGVRHVYLGQYLAGTPIWNAQASVHYQGNEVVHHTSRLLPAVRQRANITAPTLTAAAAFRRTHPLPSVRLESSELTYFPLPTGEAIRLSWHLVVEEVATGIHTLLMMDAVDGRILYSAPLTISCHFGEQQEEAPYVGQGGRGNAGTKSLGKAPPQTDPVNAGDGSMYHVFPFGIDSPNDGDRQLIFEPADPVASPYGWHDTDGEPGPEYTITRGNNVYAYRDADTTSNTPDSGYVADGGEALDFDFTFDPPQRPESVAPASMTQLFYTSNMIHDWAYRHGFDESAGNFQENNYGRGGQGNDAIQAETHDNSGSNNANFYTPKDGRAGRMQMFLWRENSIVTINQPATLAGDLPSTRAMFGRTVSEEPITSAVVIGKDGTDKPELGCAALINTEEVTGKIVMLTRGECTFQQKTFNAEAAGAIGVLICNTSNALLTMAGVNEPNDIPVTISAAMLRKKDCDRIRKAIADGNPVEVTLQDNDLTPLDGSFDNGVVAHEYGHGISNRLVGGPRRVDCLLNAEQMGEGWSDFFALASTPRTAHDRPTGVEARGVGVYSTGGSDGARGLRTQYYSTDFTVNNHTYDDIILAAVPHGLGETWASMLWDVYWGFVDAYGFDEDLINGKGGNNAAVRLVIEAMKYTPCSPGMLDGRDALLKADAIENGGANHCMLWSIFQRRGMGPSADQGNSQLHNDGREAFDIVPECVATVKLIKTVDSVTVNPGSSLTYTLTVRNDKNEAVSDLVITDELPPGLTIDASSVRGGNSHTLGSDRLLFSIDELAPGEQSTLTYTATTDTRRTSTRLYFDGAEAATERLSTISTTGDYSWIRTDTTPYSGDFAYFIPDRPTPQDHALVLPTTVTVTGERPVLRFFTKYDTEPAYDAGLVQISTDNGQSWENIDRAFLRYGYRGEVSRQAPKSLRGTPSFWGNSKRYREVIVDLTAYRGQAITVRWRFVSDTGVGHRGWWVDNIELLSELVTYDGVATLATAEGDRDTTRVSELGVVINSENTVTSTRSDLPLNASVAVFPNPASSTVGLSFTSTTTGTATLEMYSATGQRLRSQRLNVSTGDNTFDLPVQNLPSGTYTLRLSEADTVTTLKLVISR